MSFPRLFAVAAALLYFASAARAEPTVGYRHISMPDPSGPPVEVGVWYPADAPAATHRLELFQQTVAEDAPVTGHNLPLVVISHGNGGGFAGHYDTAMALARAGYVVAALTHTGDNYRDQSRAVDLPNRPRQLKLLIDYMLAGWSGRAAIDPDRIGAFGFSSGGFTVLTLAGGEADLGALGPHCRAHPGFYDCQLVGRMPAIVDTLQKTRPIWSHDARLKAVVVAAPALGFAFGKAGLAQVGVPMQLWRAEFDHVLPQPDYPEAVRQALPSAPDYHVVAGADHFDFLSPCSQALKQQAPDICTSRPGFDREAFHADFDAAVVRFFDQYLKP